MEYTQLENDYVLVYENKNILNNSFHENGKLTKSTNGLVQYFISKNESDIDNFISENSLKPKFESGAWDFESNFRFKINQIDLIEDDNLFQLLQYAKTSDLINYKIYASVVIIYVNWFVQQHLDLLLSKGIIIENNEGITDLILK